MNTKTDKYMARKYKKALDQEMRDGRESKIHQFWGKIEFFIGIIVMLTFVVFLVTLIASLVLGALQGG